MNMGGDAAERLVRDSLMITEEAVKLAGLGAKNLAAILVALAKEEEKTHGPTRLTRLLRSGEELKLLPIKSEDLRQFRRLAKEYGVLFCPIKNKSLDNGLNDILFPASAAASVNRVLEHMGYRTQILEFIDMEHTPKNILIRAVKQGKRKDNEGEIRELVKFLNVSPTIMRELMGETEAE